MNAIANNEAACLDAPLVDFELDGRAVSGRAGETLIEIDAPANRETLQALRELEQVISAQPIELS